MFYLKNNKIVDSMNRVVGFYEKGRFLQSMLDQTCDPIYKTGLTPIEMEQVSEAIQRARPRNAK
jgi:hypothetical protein